MQRRFRDAEAEAVWATKRADHSDRQITNRAVLSAIKLYMKVKADLDADPDIIASGMNCLNESQYSRNDPLPGMEFPVRRTGA